MTSIYAQKQETILGDYSLDEWKTLPSSEKAEVWNKAQEFEKQHFLKQNYPELELEGFTHESLSWADKNKITNGKTSFDFDNPPHGVKKISFDGTRFIYFYLNGEIVTEVGSISRENKLVLEGYTDTFINLDEYGEVRVTEAGIFFRGASLTTYGKTFSPNNPQEESFVRKVEDNNFLTRNTIVETDKAIFKIPRIDTNVLFKGGSFEKKYKQFVQLYGKGIVVVGKDISTEVKDNFENFIALGENLKLIDGEVEFGFNNEKTTLVRKVREAPYEIKNIKNANDPEKTREKYFTIERTEDNGPAYVRDNQQLITAGQMALTIAGTVESEVNVRAVIAGVMKVGKVDFSSIPEGVDVKGYLDAIAQSQYKSLEISTAKDFTDYFLEKYGSQAAKELLGEDFVSIIRQGIQLAERNGIKLGVDSKDYLDDVDELIVKTAKETLRLFNSAVATLPEYRDARARTVSTLVDSFMDPRFLGNTLPEDTTRIIEVGLNARGYASTYSNFADGLAKVHETYGMIPKSTKLRVEVVGDKAEGIIEAPLTKVNKGTKDNPVWENVKFETVRFTMDKQTANNLIKEMSSIPSIREELWKDYQEYLAKKNKGR